MFYSLTILSLFFATGCFVGFAAGWLAFRRRLLVDDLTGLPNQRAISSILGRRLRRAVYRRSPICVALLDVDHFKKVNTRFGYTAADGLLQEFVEKMRCNCVSKDVDLLRFRYGDEFLLVMNDMDARAGEQFLKDLAHTLGAAPFEIQGNALWLSFTVGLRAAERSDCANRREEIKRLLKDCEQRLAENKKEAELVRTRAT
jgi:diguanylate cyclase (GGDEF)-like protein